jgi:Domain of unknown function (DUF4173)
MSIATTSDLEIAPARPLLMPLVSATACVALADWLFYGWQVGISLALFFAIFGGVAVAANGVRTTHFVQMLMAAAFVAGLLALIEDVNALSVTVGVTATALVIIVVTTGEAKSWPRYLIEAATIPFRGPFRLTGDLLGALRQMKTRTPEWLGSLVAWIVPLSVFAIFLALLSSANPLIEHRLMQIDVRVLFERLDPARIWFWGLVACAIWPLLRRRSRRKLVSVPQPGPAIAAETSDLDYLLGVQAVTRSLILFNALFALQSGLDLTYLWGGVSLPGGMSHAEYAHRGAYPLIATALLAAGFVLIAMRQGGPAEQSRWIRPLVLLWTGQNVLLVISSIFRLDLYVAAYSLTYLRLTAFIWMILVAAGLVLMLIQIKLRKPNSWLIAANAATLALVLFACCFVNAPRVVASYNLAHCREISGTGPWLDSRYLRSLGPQMLPAIEPYVQRMPALASTVADYRHIFDRDRPSNWRTWTFRTWRLERYLANNPSIPPNLCDSGKG